MFKKLYNKIFETKRIVKIRVYGLERACKLVNILCDEDKAKENCKWMQETGKQNFIFKKNLTLKEFVRLLRDLIKNDFGLIRSRNSKGVLLLVNLKK